MARLGAVVGSAARGKVAVGCGTDKAAALKMALEAGLLSTGKVVWDFGAVETQFDYFVVYKD